ncbi:S-adenosyl-L-methionine-dependent methyltransferase [Rickenella mellea]|uniref:S-adenosyl-L-methionine-dependent methyltransferase n=1 Tax=Rickenella mellea TaxID=50990 RepID=A0A4Y7QJE0_9AGAM|nr:S-adenosyl-L-methionine-dependent methyltransferase [Rickenella mellea]
MEDLRNLTALISNAVKQIEESCNARQVSLPSLDDPFTLESESARLHPAVLEAVATIVAATNQLSVLVRPPALTLMSAAVQFHVPSALRTVTKANVVEILREAGPQGLHVDEIAKKNNMDPQKLARLLRLLATEHIFREVTPDVFANNRISSLADTGKSSTELFSKPTEKYTGTNGVAALIEHCGYDVFNSSACMTETLLDPETARSYDPTKAPFNRAFKTDLPFWAWFEQPGNEQILSTFGMAMKGTKALSPPDVILDGFEWKDLPSGSIVVDVGGGIGSQSLTIAQAHHHLKIVVQDREPVVKEAKGFWDLNFPNVLSSGRVTLQGKAGNPQSIDFLAGQPVKNASVFLMRMILHDWSDDLCHVILKHLREAATPSTKLLLVDNLMSFACPDTSPTTTIPGGASEPPPPPLLANYGHASAFLHMIDLQMLTALNGQERTLVHLAKLLEGAGWKLTKVYRTPTFLQTHQQILALPA